MTHAYGSLTTYPAFVGQIIDYVVAQGIAIKTAKDGYQRRRHTLNIGEYAKLNGFYISADGIIDNVGTLE
jgi:hypothetical protein